MCIWLCALVSEQWRNQIFKIMGDQTVPLKYYYSEYWQIPPLCLWWLWSLLFLITVNCILCILLKYFRNRPGSLSRCYVVVVVSTPLGSDLALVYVAFSK